MTIRISRTYDIDIAACPGDDFEEKKHSAKQLALDTFAEEMIYFESSIDDFVSAEIINPEMATKPVPQNYNTMEKVKVIAAFRFIDDVPNIKVFDNYDDVRGLFDFCEEMEISKATYNKLSHPEGGYYAKWIGNTIKAFSI